MILNNDVWKKLESESPKGERITARLALPEVSRKLYAGFDSAKQRHLLIPLGDEKEEYSDLQSKGFSIITRELVIKDSPPQKYIDITCHDSSGYIIFDVIGSEIAQKIEKNDAKDTIANVIGKWRNFWGKSAKELLSHSELIGLFAELWFLYAWLLPIMDKSKAVNAWRGPLMSRHDFELVGKSIEVKSTTNVQSRTHRIHGAEQLAVPQDGELFLFSLRLREEHGAEITLPSLITLCREKLQDDVDAISKFENALGIMGYSPLHDEEYLKYKLRVVDEKLYRITTEFPRLIADSFINGIPPGVGAVEYTINLDGYDNLCIAKSPKEGTGFFS